MSAIDFKEIPEAHLGGGLQDTFELFARDFLRDLGYMIDEDPSRGADGGKDLVVIEKRSGVGGETMIRWLVSCKHKAHSGTSVTPSDESNIRDRIESNRCDGFLGFYSTLLSSGLSIVLKGLSEKAEIQIFDREKIESYLLKSTEGLHLAKRFFPESTKAWLYENPKPAQVSFTHPKLTCNHCGKNLLEPEPSGVIVLWNKLDATTDKTHCEKVYWCCKGHCDLALSVSTRGSGLVDGWEDIHDIAIPLNFARWVISPLNKLYRGDSYSPDAFEKLKEFILNVFPYVARNATLEEQERISRLVEIPAWLGGLSTEI
jgi:hypothetical protein